MQNTRTGLTIGDNLGHNEGNMASKPTHGRRDTRLTRAKCKHKSAWGRRLASVLVFLVMEAVLTASFLVPLLTRHPRPAPTPLIVAAPVPTDTSPECSLTNPQADVSLTRLRQHGVTLVMVCGGVAGSRRFTERQGVTQFVESSGATAGVNGTFFADASLHGDDNTLIGPSLCGNEARLVAGPFDKRTALIGRPLVLLSPARTRILSYAPQTLDDDNSLHQELPGLTDAFLGGVWLVHDGIAADRAGMAQFHVQDANDPRRRAFFGLLPDGRPVLGATAGVTTSLRLAQALVDAGLREAVLLDSGFSTSLVLKDQVLVTGHTAPGLPSRPVPHALVLFDKAVLAKTKAPPNKGRA